MVLLGTWFQKNKLKLNAEKCNFICYGFKKFEDDLNTLKIHGPLCHLFANISYSVMSKCSCPNLQREKSIKYLGLTLDPKLTWEPHCKNLKNKLYKLNYLFYHLRNFFNKQHLLKIDSSIYEPSLTYGIVHMGGSSYLKNVEITQKNVL